MSKMKRLAAVAAILTTGCSSTPSFDPAPHLTIDQALTALSFAPAGEAVVVYAGPTEPIGFVKITSVFNDASGRHALAVAETIDRRRADGLQLYGEEMIFAKVGDGPWMRSNR